MFIRTLALLLGWVIVNGTGIAFAEEESVRPLSDIEISYKNANIPEANRKTILALIKDIQVKIAQLEGKNSWSGDERQHDTSALDNLLALADKETSMSIAAAIFYASKSDDFVRQSALRTILRRDNHAISNLPLLCGIFRTLQVDEAYLPDNPRGWITPTIARVRLASIIAHLLGIGTLPDRGELSENNVALKPRDWLKTALISGLSARIGHPDATIIADCLVMFGN